MQVQVWEAQVAMTTASMPLLGTHFGDVPRRLRIQEDATAKCECPQLLGNGYIAGAGDTLVALFFAKLRRFVGSDLLSSSAGFAVKPRQAFGPNRA